MLRLRYFTGLLLITGTLSSCFKEDDKIPPHDPGNVKTVAIELTSSYKYQVYFDLGSETVTGTNEKKNWDLGFECGSRGWHIILNTSNFMLAARTGTTDFSIPLDTAGLNFKYDESTGNLDSTAIGQWLEFVPPDSARSYTNEVYIIDRGYDELANQRGLKKIVFLQLEGDRYTFRYANLDGTGENTFSVTKDPTVNFVYFSFDNGGQQLIYEPASYDWDLLFSQYTTLLFTDEGEPYPYLVTGVLSNPKTISVHQDTLMEFQSVDLKTAQGLIYNTIRDEIGYDWKDVVGDVSSGNVSYVILPGIHYIIRDWQGFYYKIRFVNFYSGTGEKGYPTFEMQKL